jgi:DNA polymerase III subunit alpha
MESPNPQKRDFVHLHLHSDYSLLQSTIQLKPLAKKLAEIEMKACAITDIGNMYGAISFYLAMKAKDIRPILGYEALVTPGSRFDRSSSVAGGEKPYYSLVLLAKNFTGYENLVHLSSKAFTEGLHHKARIDRDLLSERSGDLIALSGGTSGAIWHYLKNGDTVKAEATARDLRDLFGPGNFYIQIEHHGIESDIELTKELVRIARSLEIPLVATNNVFYLEREDARAQEVLMCLSDGRTLNDPTHPSLPNDTYYLKTAEEMWAVFGDEFPDALENTLKIAEQCDVKIPTDKLILPIFPIPPDTGCNNLDEYFEKIVQEGLEERKQKVLLPMLEEGSLKYPLENYSERLETEIGIIERMGYSGYFLVVWEFIHYAKQRGIPVGPGRGSAAGSLVAYCMGITDVDPLQYELFFERFLNPERISMPDIDIDFCIRGRGEVINHVTEFYGRESVCQIITFGTMASKAAIKDVGRAMSLPLGDVEKIAKLIPPPFRGRITSISDALERVPEIKAAMAADSKDRRAHRFGVTRRRMLATYLCPCGWRSDLAQTAS